MPKHALLSASASHRWLICPPSAKLCADIKDEASPYAKQGTDAHSLCEFKVLTALGQRPPDPTEDLDYFDQEMAYCTDEYCSYVMEQLTEAKTHCKDPQVLVEQRLDFSKWVPEGFGTGDCLIVADDVLHIIDFKYGLGVLVQALSGTEYPGFKVVEGRANRKYTDEEAVAFVVKDNGYDPYEKKLLGITAMTSLLGKKKFEELLSALITKPQGKPTLVPTSDKRPALNTAKDDFSEEE